MAYREDWPEARERLIAWWRGEDIGRPALYITVPSGREVKWPEPPEDLVRRWTIDRTFTFSGMLKSCEYSVGRMVEYGLSEARVETFPADGFYVMDPAKAGRIGHYQSLRRAIADAIIAIQNAM